MISPHHDLPGFRQPGHFVLELRDLWIGIEIEIEIEIVIEIDF
jgi:hypothetical protein